MGWNALKFARNIQVPLVEGPRNECGDALTPSKMWQLQCVSAVQPVMPYQKRQKPSGFSLEGGERSFIIELCKRGHCHDKKHHPTSRGLPLIGLKARPITSGGDGSTPLSYTEQRLVITYPKFHLLPLCMSLTKILNCSGPNTNIWGTSLTAALHLDIWTIDHNPLSATCKAVTHSLWSSCQISSLLFTDEDLVQGSLKCSAQVQEGDVCCSILVHSCHNPTTEGHQICPMHVSIIQWLQEIQSSQNFLLFRQKMVYFSHNNIWGKVWLGLLAN